MAPSMATLMVVAFENSLDMISTVTFGDRQSRRRWHNLARIIPSNKHGGSGDMTGDGMYLSDGGFQVGSFLLFPTMAF